jgi:hypothetical protein
MLHMLGHHHHHGVSHHGGHAGMSAVTAAAPQHPGVAGGHHGFENLGGMFTGQYQ